jgi:chromosomal replication initiation ATPase DnaA
MAILRKKEELDGLEKYNISNEVMQYIATNVKSNIRELEGSLTKLIALHKLKKVLRKNFSILLIPYMEQINRLFFHQIVLQKILKL